jgi:Mandelate racemase / muconate lactonizing enzyme, N-terminal domain
MKGAVFSGLNRDTLQHALPPGAARNALDCAFWDLDAKRAYRSVAELAGLGAVPPLMTAFTLELVANAVLEFAVNHVDTKGPSRSPAHDYYRLEGELAGHLSGKLSVLEGVDVIQNQRMSSREADVVVRRMRSWSSSNSKGRRRQQAFRR